MSDARLSKLIAGATRVGCVNVELVARGEDRYVGPAIQFVDPEGFTFSVRADVVARLGEPRTTKPPASETCAWTHEGYHYSQRFGAGAVVVTPVAAEATATATEDQAGKSGRAQAWVASAPPIGEIGAIPKLLVRLTLAGCRLTLETTEGEQTQDVTDNRELTFSFDGDKARELARAVKATTIGVAVVGEAARAIVLRGKKGTAVLGGVVWGTAVLGDVV